MSRLQLTLLGGVQARLGSGGIVTLPIRKGQALLAYLAVAPGPTHPRDKLAALLWGDTAEEQARASLRQTLFTLRRALPPGVLTTEGDTVALDAERVEVDAVAFERRVAEGTPEALVEAAALYRGDLLAGLALKEAAFEEWLLGERERLRELALEGLARLLAHERRTGATEAAIHTGLRLLTLDPLQEPVHRALMRLHAQAGRRGAALRQYQACVAVLQRELGVEPEAETKQLYQELLRRRPVVSEQPGAGGTEPVGLAERPPRLSSADTPMRGASLIGRGPEVARLREALADIARGRGAIVAVVGEAGIGKSSLLAGLGADADEAGARVLLGRCHESEQLLPFAPWTDALRTGKVLGDEHALSRLGTRWRAELARLLPEADAPGLPPPRDDPGRLFEAILLLLEHMAGGQPLVLMVEDVHWADEMSLRLLAFVARKIRSTPVLILATMREEELDSTPALRQILGELRREPHFVILTLAPLSPTDTTALVRTLARAGRDEATLTRLSEQVWQASEGNPFLAVETMRALEEDAVGTVPRASPLPQRVRELIATRLDHLGPTAQNLVAVAAVIGRDFEFSLVQQAAEIPERDAAAAMEELVRQRLLQGVGERFDFVHERIRDVAYDRLLAPRRRVLHASVARALEEQHAGDLEGHYAALGGHYRAAERWERAARYLYLAGEKALTYADYRGAAPLFEAAVVALERAGEPSDPVLELDACLELWVARFEVGRYPELPPLAEKMDALALKLEDRGRLAKVRLRQAQASRLLRVGPDALDTTIAHAAEAFALAAADDLRTRSYARYLAAVAKRDLGHLPEAIAEFDSGVALFETSEHKPNARGLELPIYVSLCAWRAEARAVCGGFEDGIVSATEALRVADDIEHPSSRAIANAFLGYVLMMAGDLEGAVSPLSAGLALAESTGVLHAIIRNAAALASALCLLGRPEAGVRHLDRAIQVRDSTATFMPDTTRFGTLTATACLAAGRVAEARAEVDRGMAHVDASSATGHRPQLLRLRAEILARSGAYAEATSCCDQGLRLASQMGMRPEVAHAHLALGRVLSLAGDRAGARRHREIASAMLEKAGMRFWRIQAEAR